MLSNPALTIVALAIHLLIKFGWIFRNDKRHEAATTNGWTLTHLHIAILSLIEYSSDRLLPTFNHKLLDKQPGFGFLNKLKRV